MRRWLNLRFFIHLLPKIFDFERNLRFREEFREKFVKIEKMEHFREEIFDFVITSSISKKLFKKDLKFREFHKHLAWFSINLTHLQALGSDYLWSLGFSPNAWYSWSITLAIVGHISLNYTTLELCIAFILGYRSVLCLMF